MSHAVCCLLIVMYFLLLYFLGSEGWWMDVGILEMVDCFYCVVWWLYLIMKMLFLRGTLQNHRRADVAC